MALTIPAGCWRQPVETSGTEPTGDKSFLFVVRGNYSDLDGLALNQGMEIVDGWVAQSWQLARNPGDTGTLTITCVVASTIDSNGRATEPLSETWEVKSVRNDMSIMGYCGGGANNPVREWVEAWQKEPDGSIAKYMQFRKSDGTVFDLNAVPIPADEVRAIATKELIGKIQAGIDTVMRFYPMLICKKTYSAPPASVYAHLSEINTPAPGSTDVKMPGNLDTIISGHVWLKCQDDAAQQTDNKWIRTEAWIGAVSWDENLYGVVGGGGRWPVPYDHVNNQG